MTDDRFDLDAYLARVGYAGVRTPTLETLRALHFAHASAIAFENLDPFLRVPIGLDAESLQAKLVRGGRGGWCFEQNGLFRLALQALGFHVTGLAARVMWNMPAEVVRPRGHMLLRVEVDGESYLADVGFGGLTLTAPLALRLDEAQATPHEPFRLVAGPDDTIVMQAQVRGEWRPLYRFDLQPQRVQDYEVTCWYLANHPSSHFLAGIMAARPGDGVRHALRDNVLTAHRVDGSGETRVLESPAELREVLEQLFGLELPAGEATESMLREIAARRPVAQAV